MPSIQGTHRITIQPPQPSVVLQCAVDCYGFYGNTSEPKKLSIKSIVKNISSPIYSWEIWNDNTGTFDKIPNGTKSSIDIEPSKEWGGSVLISCLVKDTQVPSFDGVRGRIHFHEKTRSEQTLEVYKEDDENWASLIKGDIDHLTLVCSNPYGIKLPDFMAERLSGFRVTVIMNANWGKTFVPRIGSNIPKDADMKVLIPSIYRVLGADGLVKPEVHSIIEGYQEIKATPVSLDGMVLNGTSCVYDFLFVIDGINREHYCIWLNNTETLGLHNKIEKIRSIFNEQIESTVGDVFTARKSELKGRDGAGVYNNLLKGFKDKIIVVPKGSNYTHNVIVSESRLESNKNYLLVANYTCTSEKKPEFITLWDYYVTDKRSDTAYNGNPTRVALFVPASNRASGTRGLLGYAGMYAHSENISAEYSNIMLLEWGDSWDGVIPPYFPHVDDLKVTADEVSASLIASSDFKANLSVSTAELLNNNTEFKKAVKGEKGEQGVNGVDGTSVTLADLNIRWNGTSLVVGGVTSGDLKGEKGDDGKSVKLSDLGISWAGDRLTIGGVTSESLKGETGARGPQGAQGAKGADGKSVTIADLKANASFMQHTAREVAKFGEFATTEQLSKELLHLKREFREVERESDKPYTVILEDPELHNEGKVVEVGFKESLSCVYDDGRILHSGDVYSSEMQILPKKNGYILPPNENSCYHNHFVFKVVRYENKKVWQWENYELLKVSKTVQAVAGHSLSIQSVEQDVGLLKGQVRNLQSKEIDINNQLLEQGGNINTLFQKHSRTETEVEALKAGEHKITIKSLRNASIVSAPLNTLQMTHNTTANSLYLPSPSEGLSFRLWANHWVNKTITIHKPSFPSENFLINTATNTQISSLTLIVGHLYDFVAVSYNTWIVTDLSR